jgi:hypothetical protein
MGAAWSAITFTRRPSSEVANMISGDHSAAAIYWLSQLYRLGRRPTST